jgi:tetratricopeptide (TPR) repeat protein
VAAVREAVGVAAYHAGDYAEAARELRAYRRMSGDQGYRAVLADCERAMGRPEVALRLVAEALADAPGADELVELRLVEAGVRRDLGEPAAARLVLEDALGGGRAPEGLSADDPGRLRLAAAYADLLSDQGEHERAEQWSAALAAVDEDDVAGTGRGPQVVFSEEEIEVEPVAPDEPAVDELDLDDDIEAEVAELLGEDHPLAHPENGPPSTGD